MNHLARIGVAFALVFFAGASVFITASPISGTVKLTTGEAAPGVKIVTYAKVQDPKQLLKVNLGTQRYEAVTNSSGVFAVPAHGRLLFLLDQICDHSPKLCVAATFEKANT